MALTVWIDLMSFHTHSTFVTVFESFSAQLDGSRETESCPNQGQREQSNSLLVGGYDGQLWLSIAELHLGFLVIELLSRLKNSSLIHRIWTWPELYRCSAAFGHFKAWWGRHLPRSRLNRIQAFTSMYLHVYDLPRHSLSLSTWSIQLNDHRGTITASRSATIQL